MSKGTFSDHAMLDHYNRHGQDFGAKTPADYERLADLFLNGPRPVGALDQTRTNGDLVRYNPITDEFGIATPDGTIRTYFEPNPLIHGFPTNLDYFYAQ